ncbi:MAG TPA: fluoride efflux transporter CrcB [Gammaproteobacteria bacterium]|nr:fluoride efflux transporter CrcB [Gammaproteobacteria bacterium]
MKSILFVALGGAIGAVARYMLSGWVLHHTIDWRFPLGTFLVNCLGCFAIGILGGLIVKADLLSSDSRIFLITGVLGGFTTFSAFGLETFYLLRRGEVLLAGANITLSIFVALLALWLGFALVPGRG